MRHIHQIARIINEDPNSLNEYADEDLAYEKIEAALNRASLPWDQDEDNVLYGKWIDMTLHISPTETKRVQGVVTPIELTGDEEHSRPYLSGLEIDGHKFNVSDIVEIHDIKSNTTYDDIYDEMLRQYDMY